MVRFRPPLTMWVPLMVRDPCRSSPTACAAWAAEIGRRVTQIETGAVKLEVWEDERSRMEREILNR